MGKSIANDNIIVGKGKRFAVLLCAEEDSEYSKKKYGGVYGLFLSFLKEEGESWDVFKVAKNEFPNDQELEMYDGFVVSGSSTDAHSNEEWICNLLIVLQKLDSLKKRVLGICFGHQILARALGGKTGRSNSGWDIGMTPIHISSSSHDFFSSDLELPTTLSIVQIHQDEIWELPPKAEGIGWSKKTPVEMFRYGDHIMGIQGHPESNRDMLFHKIDCYLRRKIISETYANEVRAKLMVSPDPNKEAWRKLCISFLKRTHAS